MDSDLYFGKIEIVEWLGERDAKTGRELHDFLADLLPHGLAEVDLEFRRASTRREFLTCLEGVAQSVRHSGRIPLLHVETPGNPHGIGPPGQETLSWPELAPALVAINQLTKLRLFVFLAACEGIWAMKMVVPTHRAPVFGILGPNRDISAGQLADACKVFYSALARTRSATAAITEMNAAVSEDRIFSVAGAELLFSEVWKYYLEDPSLSKDVAERVKPSSGMCSSCTGRSTAFQCLQKSRRASGFRRRAMSKTMKLISAKCDDTSSSWTCFQRTSDVSQSA